MDNRDDEDDKRRVMTPPAEWGGDDGADDILGGDAGWLSDPEPEAQSESAPETEPDPEPEPTSATKPAADDDDSDLGWLTVEGLEAAPPSSVEAEAPMDSLSTTSDEEPAATALVEEPEAIGQEPPTALSDDGFDSGFDEDGLDSNSDHYRDDNLDDKRNDTGMVDESDNDSWLDDTNDLASAPDLGNDSPLVPLTEPEPIVESTPEPIPEPEPQPTTPGPVAAEPDDDWISAPVIDQPTVPDDVIELSTAKAAPSAEALLTDHKVAQAAEGRKLPLIPIVATVVALILVGVGGWGAFAERSALQARVAELEGQLGAVRKRGDLSADDEASLQADNQSMRLQLATMREQYAAMSSEIQSLEQRLLATVESGSASLAAASETDMAADADNSAGEQRSDVEAADPEPVTPSRVAASTTADASDVAPADSADTADLPATSSSGDWFVNIASYSRKDIADEWAAKIGKDVERVVQQDVEVNGKALHRVRAVGFESKGDAQAAAKVFETKYSIGPLWVGRESGEAIDSSAPAPKPISKAEAVAPKPVALPASTGAGGWFVYVDTYARGVDADTKAKAIGEAGYEAKVAVEYRSGELFYRVQVVGIDSRETGERIVEELAALGDMPNLQLRQY